MTEWILNKDYFFTSEIATIEIMHHKSMVWLD